VKLDLSRREGLGAGVQSAADRFGRSTCS
jgi:hypothetical protein